MTDYIKRIKSYLLQDEIRHLYGFTPTLQVSFLAQGEYNKNYLVDNGNEKYVFRVNMDSQLNLNNQIEYEFKAIKQLEKSGVTPIGYFVDDTKHSFNEGVLMMNYLEGRPLNYSTDLGIAAEIFSKIHLLDTQPFRKHLITEERFCRARVTEADEWLKAFRESQKPQVEVKQLLERVFDFCSKMADIQDRQFADDPWLVVNNTEVNSYNFIIGKNKSYLIDWEKPVISDPVQDITQFLAPTTTLWRSNYLLDDREKEHFFDVYEEGVGRPIRDRVDKYKPFLYLRALSWCAGAWVSYTDNTRNIRNESTLKVINRYLEPAFLKKIINDIDIY